MSENKDKTGIDKSIQIRIVRLMKALWPEVKVYLFGSRARGKFEEGADIDIALDNGQKIHFLDLAMARNIIEALYLPQKIDVVDMNSIPEAMKNIILKEGIEWKL